MIDKEKAKRKRYLFFDIDRTLTAGGYQKSYVPESAKFALAKMRSDGHFLCLATGRSQAMALEYMRELGFENMVSDGGIYNACVSLGLINP